MSSRVALFSKAFFLVLAFWPSACLHPLRHRHEDREAECAAGESCDGVDGVVGTYVDGGEEEEDGEWQQAAEEAPQMVVEGDV